MCEKRKGCFTYIALPTAAKKASTCQGFCWRGRSEHARQYFNDPHLVLMDLVEKQPGCLACGTIIATMCSGCVVGGRLRKKPLVELRPTCAILNCGTSLVPYVCPLRAVRG